MTHDVDRWCLLNHTSLHEEQGHALPIARLQLQDLLYGMHFRLLLETLTHLLLSVVD